MTSATLDRRLGLTGAVAIKAPCRAYTTAAITLSGEQTVNGIAIVTGDRCLVKNQNSSVDNGVYVVSTSAWTRDLDFNGTNDVVTGTLVPVYNGVGTYAMYALSTVSPVIGTSNITFETVDAITFQGLLSASSGSSLVGFIQSGTGAVARTVQAKLREHVSLDDYLAAQNPLTYLSSGGVVEGQAGTYTITAALTASNNTEILGKGKNVTVITQSTNSERGITLPNALRVRVSELTLTPPASPSNFGVYADKSQELTFTRVQASGWDGGFKFLGTGGVLNTDWFNNIIRLDQCVAIGSLTNPNLDWQGLNLVASNCDFSHLPASGTRAAVRIRSVSYDSLFENCYYEHGALLAGGNVYQCEGGVTRIKGGFAIGGQDGTHRVGSFIAASGGAIVIVEGVTGFNYWTNLVTADGAGTVVYVMPGTFTGSFDATTRFVETNGGKVIDLSHDHGSFTATLTGCTTSPTGTVKYKRDGDVVTLLMPTIQATSNTTACTLTGLPASLTPVTTQTIFCNVFDSGADFTGGIQFTSAGAINLFKIQDIGATAFTNSGVKGVQGPQVLTYTLF